MKLLGISKSKISKDENVGNVPHLEIIEVVLMHCNIAYNDYQQDSRILYKFVPNKSFGQLLDVLPKNFIFLKTFNSEFSYIEVWFTDQNCKPLEIQDKINITLVINLSVKCKNKKIFVKSYVILSFSKKMGKNIGKNISESLSGKYSQKHLDQTKKSAAGALKTSSKRVTQKSAEATGDLIGNKIANKITKV